MPKEAHLQYATSDEIKKLMDAGGDRTDWARVRETPQDVVERLADDEDGTLPAGWEENIVLGVPEPKQDVHIRLDPMVLRWFKTQGPGYQTRINAVLRAFVEAKMRRAGD